jgi:hypothetical protein
MIFFGPVCGNTAIVGIPIRNRDNVNLRYNYSDLARRDDPTNFIDNELPVAIAA